MGNSGTTPENPSNALGLSKTSETIIAVSVSIGVAVILLAILTHCICLKERRKAQVKYIEAQTPASNNNQSFLQKHLATLRAWTKPTVAEDPTNPNPWTPPPENAEAGPSRGLDIDFDAPKPAQAAKEKKLYYGKPMEHFINNPYVKMKGKGKGKAPVQPVPHPFLDPNNLHRGAEQLEMAQLQRPGPVAGPHAGRNPNYQNLGPRNSYYQNMGPPHGRYY
jgi:hypothetical protein